MSCGLTEALQVLGLVDDVLGRPLDARGGVKVHVVGDHLPPEERNTSNICEERNTPNIWLPTLALRSQGLSRRPCGPLTWRWSRRGTGSQP